VTPTHAVSCPKGSDQVLDETRDRIMRFADTITDLT
jgi:hypothetical protein